MVLFSVRDLSVEAYTAAGTVMPVRRFDLTLNEGDIVGVIGESGSGKTTAVRSMIGLLERNVHIVDGDIRFRGDTIRSNEANRFDTVRGRSIGMVFQSPQRSLNPVRTIASQIGEVLTVLRPDMTRDERQDRMRHVMSSVGFSDVERVLRSYPHALSGGMCQRAAIAAAIAPEPSILIADEATSALDVTTQAEVVTLLKHVTLESDRALVFVTHDILLAAELCSRIVVMYAGEIVEEGLTEQVVNRPRHPYSQALLSAVPLWEPKTSLKGIAGRPPRVLKGFTGCGFADRCAHVREDCRTTIDLQEVAGNHKVRCVLVGDSEDAREAGIGV